MYRYHGNSIIGLQDLFVFDKNNKGSSGHPLKRTKMRCTRQLETFFSNRVVNRWNKMDLQIMGDQPQRF